MWLCKNCGYDNKPQSAKSKLEKILCDHVFDKYGHSELFDFRLYVASFVGYGLHSNCMLTLGEFRKSCKWFLETAKNQAIPNPHVQNLRKVTNNLGNTWLCCKYEVKTAYATLVTFEAKIAAVRT